MLYISSKTLFKTRGANSNGHLHRSPLEPPMLTAGTARWLWLPVER